MAATEQSQTPQPNPSAEPVSEATGHHRRGMVLLWSNPEEVHSPHGVDSSLLLAAIVQHPSSCPQHNSQWPASQQLPDRLDCHDVLGMLPPARTSCRTCKRGGTDKFLDLTGHSANDDHWILGRCGEMASLHALLRHLRYREHRTSLAEQLCRADGAPLPPECR